MQVLSRYQNRHGGKNKIKRLLWEVVWTCLARPTPRWCLNGWRCFLLRLFGAKIGRGCRIQGGADIWQPWNLTLGDNCWIDGDVKLYSVDKIVLGSNCVISSGAFICTASHDIRSETFDLVTKPITMGAGVWIASRAIVLPGVNLGMGSVIAAGAVVTKNVDDGVIVGGNPAQLIGKR